MPNVESIGVAQLDAAQRKTLASLKAPVLTAAKSFAAIREKLSDLAPKILKLYNGIVAQHESFTFVEFARLFDSSIPTHAADRGTETGYRNHRVYYTLAYMRRIVQTARMGRRGQQGVRDSATDGLARVLATLIQTVSDPAPLWDAVQSEFAFSERVMTRLRKRVAATQPLVKLEVSRPAKIGTVIHMDRLTPAEPAGEPMQARGKRVTVETRNAAKAAAA